jgi:hypothetical protein
MTTIWDISLAAGESDETANSSAERFNMCRDTPPSMPEGSI